MLLLTAVWVSFIFFLSSGAKPVFNDEVSIYDTSKAFGASHESRDLHHSARDCEVFEASSMIVRGGPDFALSRRVRGFDLISYRFNAVILPPILASIQMKNFFDQVTVRAMTTWASEPESALFTITQGRLQLTFSGLGGTVEWGAVAAAARSFSAMANQIPGVFDAYYAHEDTDFTIAISLRLLDALIPLGPMTISKPMQRHLLQRSLTSSTNSNVKTRRSNGGASLSMTHFRRFSSIVPSLAASMKFEDFYNIIALKIETGGYASYIPSKSVTLELWDFELIVTCDKVNIPLSFIQEYAIEMADLTSRQWTGFYEAIIKGQGPLNGLVFWINMRLKDGRW